MLIGSGTVETAPEELDISSEDLFAEFAEGKTGEKDEKEDPRMDGDVEEESEETSEEESDGDSERNIKDEAEKVEAKKSEKIGKDSREKTEEELIAELPPTIRDRLAKAEKDAKDWQHKYKSDEGRITALQNKVKKLEGQVAEKEETLEDFTKAFTSKKAFENFKELHPETADVLTEFMEGFTASASKKLDKVAKSQKGIEEDAVKEANARAADNFTKEFGEQWKTWVVSDDFEQWLTPSQRIILEEGSEEESRALLDNYRNRLIAQGKLQDEPSDTDANDDGHEEKEKIAKTEEKRKKQLEDGTTTESKGGSAKPISDADTGSLFDYYADKKRSKK